MAYNQSNLTIKRLMGEYQALIKNPEDNFVAAPLESDLFTWHFIIKGPKDTAFEGGIYHGKVLFPTNYPYAPPDIMFLTPNGRYELNKKICLTVTSFHPEMWQPAWDIRTVLTALISMFPAKAEGAIGAIDLPDNERKRLAKHSRKWKCEDEECKLHLEPDNLPEDSQINDEETPSTDVTANQDSRQPKRKPQISALVRTSLGIIFFVIIYMITTQLL